MRAIAGGLALCCLVACGPAQTGGSSAVTATKESAAAAPTTSSGAPVTVPAVKATLEIIAGNTSIEYGSPADLVVSFTAGQQPISDAVVTVSVGSLSQELTTDSTGAAKLTVAAKDLTAGVNTITAVFIGNDEVAALSADAIVTVTPATATLALTATPNLSGTTTVVATLSTSAVVGTGTVSFVVDGAALGSAPLSDNTASYEVPATLGLGDHLITATFAADNPAQLTGGTASATISVTKIPTTVLATTKDSVRYGDQATFTIAVQSAAAADLTGAVDISDGTSIIAQGTADAAGRASLSFLNRADPGQLSYTVTFAGTDTVGASSSQFILTTAQTNVDISIDKPSISPNSDGTIQVSLIGTPDKPTGQVTVTFDGAAVASGSVDADGKISAPVTAVPAGSHEIVVSYAGDARFEANTVTSTLTVKQPLDNPNLNGAAAIEANNPCPVTAAACVDLTNELAWLQSGGKVTYGPVAMTSGRAGHRTGVGTFNVYWLDKNHKSRLFNDAPMPNSVFFDGGIAFHQGSLSVQSHGCIHLSGAASEVFFDNLVLGDQVVVFGTEPY